MPEFTIPLTQNTVDRLQAQVQRTNENAGTILTLQQWLALHLKELAIADDLAAAAPAINEQAEKDARTAAADAIRQERDRLLAALDGAEGGQR